MAAFFHLWPDWKIATFNREGSCGWLRVKGARSIETAEAVAKISEEASAPR
jgi:hypothetical protein